VRIAPLAAEDALARRDELAVIWTDVTADRLGEILPRHAARDGFRFLVAEEDGQIAGFAYGYLGGPGQWWHDIVASAMTAEQRQRWLAPGHFEFVELHVRRALRRRGIGGALHDALLDGLESRTAVLSTQSDNSPALALYLGRGWQVVLEDIRFAPGGRPYYILGLDLA
jgi:ribosomal protein S18 acetylase RimI-like enzyme